MTVDNLLNASLICEVSAKLAESNKRIWPTYIGYITTIGIVTIPMVMTNKNRNNSNNNIIITIIMTMMDDNKMNPDILPITG